MNESTAHELFHSNQLVKNFYLRQCQDLRKENTDVRRRLNNCRNFCQEQTEKLLTCYDIILTIIDCPETITEEWKQDFKRDIRGKEQEKLKRLIELMNEEDSDSESDDEEDEEDEDEEPKGG